MDDLSIAFGDPHLPATALQQLIDLQRSLYDRAITEAHEYSGAGSVAIGQYQREFEASLPSDFSSTTERKLLTSIDKSKLVLFGDFHSHKQNQRAFLRILHLYQNRPDHAPIAVYLEMFKSKDQAHLDAWLAGELTDQDLQEIVKYHQTWGFPWNNYKPILDYCKQHKIPLIAINTARGGQDSLDKRDAHAANIMHKKIKSHPAMISLCLIGEFHLADRHLPSALSAQKAADAAIPILRIFANLDKYFFAISANKIHRPEEYLALNHSTYCVINSPPWMKWHSHSICEEIRRVGPIPYLENALAPDHDVVESLDAWGDHDERLYAAESLDLDQYLRDLQQQLVMFLKLSVASDIFDRYHVVHGMLDGELSHIPPRELNSFLVRATTDGFAVDYSNRLVYMPVISINSMSAAAGQMLFGSLSQFSETYTDSDHLFTQQCLKYTFGFITNKLLNPRLPLHSLKQLETYTVSFKGKRMLAAMKRRQSAAQATLKLHSWISSAWTKKGKKTIAIRQIPAKYLKQNTDSSDEICRNLAQLISEPICRGLVSGRIDIVDLQNYMTRDCKNIRSAKETLAAMISLTD
jgi:Haem-binding uptake, Tiki superfamily, ChaN